MGICKFGTHMRILDAWYWSLTVFTLSHKKGFPASLCRPPRAKGPLHLGTDGYAPAPHGSPQMRFLFD
jgi:hypothetical protein